MLISFTIWPQSRTGFAKTKEHDIKEKKKLNYFSLINFVVIHITIIFFLLSTFYLGNGQGK